MERDTVVSRRGTDGERRRWTRQQGGEEAQPARGGETLDSRRKRGTQWGERDGLTAAEGREGQNGDK